MMDRREMLKNAAAAAAAGAMLPLAEAAASPGTGPAAPPAPRITLRRAAERGHANYGWLDTRYTFSFANYLDRRHMGFRDLRVINEDWIAAGQGFPTHPHNDMEIVTYVLEGSLQHRDTLGNGSVIVPGEVQRMSAGTGIRHSEYNPSGRERVHLLQIWILPDRTGHKPSYEQKRIPGDRRKGVLRLVASSDGRDGSVTIHSSTNLYATLLDKGARVVHRNAPGRHVWVQVARGAATLNGIALAAGDGASTSDAGDLALAGGEGGAELLLFDLA